MFAAGRIMTDLIGRQPFFSQTTPMSYLRSVFEFTGRPSMELLSPVLQTLQAREFLDTVPQQPSRSLGAELSVCGADLDFLELLLQLDPTSRPTAEEASAQHHTRNTGIHCTVRRFDMSTSKAFPFHVMHLSSCAR
jgi:hypothetical protein